MYITKNLGRYYLGNNERQWCVQIRLPDGTWLGEKWPEDDEPEIDGLPPSEVVELISARLETYWINTGREEARKKIAWCRENAEALDRAWAKFEVERLQKRATELTDRADELRRRYLDV